MLRIAVILCLFLFSCQTTKKMQWPANNSAMTGSTFYKKAAAMQWQERDSLAVRELLIGNIPDFLHHFKAVHNSFIDSVTGKKNKVIFYVAPDYLAIGNQSDWARINITPMAGQRVADSLHCFLPTKKMVDLIYQAAAVKLEPVPMYAYRDSTPTMWQHHLIIEGQRKRKKGLIAGIKKDVVISGKLLRDTKNNRVAIYGWHQLNGKPIQPLYTGHVNWWVDYSQGIRLVYRKVKVNGKWRDYTSVFQDKNLRQLLCDEEFCDCYRYPY